jgi:hypothetical protein
VKGTDGIKSGKLRKKIAKSTNSDVIVFAFFLLLSFIFWYLNSLGKDSESDIKYSVQFINLPKVKVITADPLMKVNLYIKGPGYEILKLKIAGSSTPFKIDISKVNYKRTQGNNTFNYYLLTSGLAKSMSTQLRSECEIISIKPDTLFFTLDKLVPVSE